MNILGGTPVLLYNNYGYLFWLVVIESPFNSFLKEERLRRGEKRQQINKEEEEEGEREEC